MADAAARERGFSLVEIVFVVGVLAIALLGLVSVITTGLQVTSLTREREVAAEEARRQLEHLNGLDRADIVALIDADFVTEMSASQQMAEILGPDPANPVVVRWLSEREASAIFGQSVDLNADGDTTDTADDTFAMYPVRITVYWRSVFGRDNWTANELDVTPPTYPVVRTRILGMVYPRGN